MPSLFYAGQPDYIEKLNTLATAASMTNGTVAASFLSLAVTGTATAASFVGPLTGNASTATTLATARNINGVSFNGSADITVTAAAGTLSGATLAAGVTASSLTSVGTLTALTVSGQASFAAGTAAAPSVKVGAEQNGLYSSAANTLDVTLGGVRQFQFAHTANAVNFAAITGGATGNAVGFNSAGSDLNIGLNISTKGTGPLTLLTNSYGNVGLRVINVASSVNFLSIYPGVTGTSPTMYADGTDAAVNYSYSLKGAGSHLFYTSSTSALQLAIAHVASTVNFVQVTGGATGNAATITVGGTDSNRSLSLTAVGTGLVQITNDSLRIVTSKTPASATATGTQGQIAWDASYIYVCTATDTWKRAALSTW